MSKLLSTLEINSVEIPVIEFSGERVLPFKLIDQVHGRAEGSTIKSFNNNRQRFVEDKDFFEVCRGQFVIDIWEGFGFHTKAPNGFLFTQRGYLKLVKSFTDDLSWDIQDELVDHYFKPAIDKSKITAKEYRLIRSKISTLTLKLSNTIDACAFEVLMTEIKDLCDAIQYPLPDFKKLGKDYRQAVLPGLDDEQGEVSHHV